MIGADGAGSVVRKKILKLQNVEDKVDWLGVSYKELLCQLMPMALSKLIKSLSIYGKREAYADGLPNLDSSFTMTLYLPEKDSEVKF